MQRAIFIGLLLMLFTGCFNSNKESGENINNKLSETIEEQSEIVILTEDLTTEKIEKAKNNLYENSEVIITRKDNEIEKMEITQTGETPSRIFKTNTDVLINENITSSEEIISKLNMDSLGYTQIELEFNSMSKEEIMKNYLIMI